MIWNPWHGCQKYSEGCENCYVYRLDRRHHRESSFIVKKNSDFDLPQKRTRTGSFKLVLGDKPDYVYTCMTSDFFVEDADLWRPDIWRMIRERPDLPFFIITKRIKRFHKNLPTDWGNGYDNVTICCTIENQRACDERLEHFLSLPIKHKLIAAEPLLEPVNFKGFHGKAGEIKGIVAGGESGEEARPCDYAWIMDIREQCAAAGVGFRFKQTGARFIKDGKLYQIPRAVQHEQARKAGIDLKF